MARVSPGMLEPCVRMTMAPCSGDVPVDGSRGKASLLPMACRAILSELEGKVGILGPGDVEAIRIGHPALMSPATGATRGAMRGASGRRTAPGYAGVALAAFLVPLWGAAVWRVLARSEDWWQLVLGCAYLTALVASQLWYFRPRHPVRSSRAMAAFLLIQALLVYLPVVQFSWWLGVPGVLGGSLLLLLRPRVAVPLASTVVVSFAYLGLLPSQRASTALESSLGPGPAFGAVFYGVTTFMTALVVFGLTRLAGLIQELDEARSELTRRAVAEQRLRFTSELHDRLTVRLSSIALATGRIRDRLETSEPETRTDDLSHVIGTARRALAEVRKVAQDPDLVERRDIVRGDQTAAATTTRRAHGAVVTTLLCFGVIIEADLLILQQDWTQAGVGAVFLAGVLGVQVGYFARPDSRRQLRFDVLALAVQGIAAYLLVLLYGGSFWLTIMPFVAANALLALRPVLSWLLAAAVLASVGWIRATEPADHAIAMGGPPALAAVIDTAGYLLWMLTSVAAVFWMTRLARLVADLQHMRRQLADTAVAEERSRFARDVHDLLGVTLSALTLKAELAQRLMTIDPRAADAELAEIGTHAGHAIGEVRSIANGDQHFALGNELRSAEALLASSEIEATIIGAHLEVPEPQAGVLAAVVREAVTNVLRHSGAGHCQIAVIQFRGSVGIELVNDGLPTQPNVRLDDGGGGQGIENLRQRLAHVGGDLTSGPDGGGRYQIRATMPM